MFVRWKRRRLLHGHDVSHYAVLVENTWRHGAAHQRVVCYLAHIRERYRTAPAHRAWFWRRAEARLNQVGLAPDVRQRIEAHLAAAVPRPTEQERQQVDATRALLERLDA
jgi:hypothetical protein